MVAPTDPRLPNGGGYTLTGFYDVVPTKFGQVRNLNALSDNYGSQFENWNGVDVTVNARLAEWPHAPGRPQHRQDDGGQLRNRGASCRR